MAISSGAQRALTEAASWLSAGAVLIGVVLYHNEIRTALGLRYEPKPAVEQAESHGPAQRPDPGTAPVSRDTSGSVRLGADAYGHFNTTAYVNGSSVDVLVDTGATTVALTWDDARAAGLHVRDSDFTLRSQTANGTAFFAPVTIASVRIGDITVYDVRAAVARPGQLHRTLLGMSFLGKVRVEMRDRELVLSR